MDYYSCYSTSRNARAFTESRHAPYESYPKTEALSRAISLGSVEDSTAVLSFRARSFLRAKFLLTATSKILGKYEDGETLFTSIHVD